VREVKPRLDQTICASASSADRFPLLPGTNLAEPQPTDVRHHRVFTHLRLSPGNLNSSAIIAIFPDDRSFLPQHSSRHERRRYNTNLRLVGFDIAMKYLMQRSSRPERRCQE
jgi:hypothetical protein